MKSFSLIFICMALFSNSVFSGGNHDEELCLFYPVKKLIKEHEITPYHLEKPFLSDRQIQGLITVFKFYKIKYIHEKKSLLIPCVYFNDIEELATITAKSTDRRWLKQFE